MGGEYGSEDSWTSGTTTVDPRYSAFPCRREEEESEGSAGRQAPEEGPHQSIVVVNLNDDARRLLLDELQGAVQLQVAHQQTLVPCGAEGLVDDLDGDRTRT